MSLLLTRAKIGSVLHGKELTDSRRELTTEERGKSPGLRGRGGGPNRETSNAVELEGKIAALEAELALYRQALEDARQDFQAFAYSVSHDLRAPLRAIEGFSRILLDDFSGQLDADARRFLQHVAVNTRQLGSQIEDLLRFYRAGKNSPNKIPLESRELLRSVLGEMAGEIPPNVNIEQSELPAVTADPIQLREIFAQLISNALKFTRNSATPRIEIGAKIEPAAITFFVRDNGIGFEPKSASQLFQVFQKLHSASEYPGNGIGLAIVKRFVSGHGGCVRAEGETGKGACFYFSLPQS